MKKLIVGLGNPGADYATHRHNVGWMVIQKFRTQHMPGHAEWTEKFNSFFLEAGGIKLMKPTTFMNTSGEAVATAAGFFKIEPKDIIVIHDEMDIPMGDVRVKKGGGHAGHRGVKSVIDRLGTPDFHRVRCGIGRPDEGVEVLQHVLGSFKQEDVETLSKMLDQASKEVFQLLDQGISEDT